MFAVRLFLIIASFCTLSAQNPSSVRLTSRRLIGAFGEVRSDVIRVKAVELVRVFPEHGDTGTPEIDSYIYDKHRYLLAKDTEESVTERFEWHAPVDTHVYVIARNVGKNAGTVVIQVSTARAATVRAR